MTDEIRRTMRAVVHDRHGDPRRVLRFAGSISVPAPGPGEVLVRMSIFPVHPGDVSIVAGGGDESLLPKPRIPGFEGVGVVAALGDGVSDLEVGQRVALFLFPNPGAWAEYVTAAAKSLVPVPDKIDDATASMMLVNPFTAQMLVRAAEDAWSETAGAILQTAAGSSVGQFVAAIAERRGYPLVNLVRSQIGADRLARRFASPTFITSDLEWLLRVREILGGPATVIFDAVGGALAYDLMDVLEDGGTIVSYGALSGSNVTLNDIALGERNLQARSVSVGQWSLLSTERRAADVAFALDLARTRPDLFEIAGTYNFADFALAIEEVVRPGKIGTVLLTSAPNG